MGGGLPLAPASSPPSTRVGSGRLWWHTLPPLRDAAPRNAQRGIGMNTVKLRDVCTINPAVPNGVRDGAYQSVAFVPMSSLQTDGTIESVELRPYSEVDKGYKYFEIGDVLFAKITPCMENGKAGLVQELPTQVGFGSTEFHVLRPREDLLPRYLSLFVRQQRFRENAAKNMTGAGGQRRVPTGYLEGVEIPLPPLDDQKRIAHLLGKVEGLIAQRKQHLQQLDALLKSVFLEMFGDPVKNEKGWEKTSFANASISARNGLSPSSGGKFKGNVYTLSAVTGEYFREIYKCDTFSKSVDGYTPTTDDFLVCRGNGNIGLVGRGHFFPGKTSDVIFPDTIIGVRLKAGVFEQRFLDALWKTSYIRSQIESLARTANGTFKINQTSLGEIEVIVPAKESQSKFSGIATRIEAIKTRYQQSLADLEALCGTLSQSAFAGELDLSRVLAQGVEG